MFGRKYSQWCLSRVSGAILLSFQLVLRTDQQWKKCRLWWQTAYLWEEILYLRIVAFKVQRKKTALCSAQPHRTSNAGILLWLKVLHVSKNTEKHRIWLGLESICSKNTLYQNRKPLNFLTSFFPFSFFSQRQTHQIKNFRSLQSYRGWSCFCEHFESYGLRQSTANT